MTLLNKKPETEDEIIEAISILAHDRLSRVLLEDEYEWLCAKMKVIGELSDELKTKYRHRAAHEIPFGELSVRTCNVLRSYGIKTFEQLLSREARDLLCNRNFGLKSLRELGALVATLDAEIPDSWKKYVPASHGLVEIRCITKNMDELSTK